MQGLYATDDLYKYMLEPGFNHIQDITDIAGLLKMYCDNSVMERKPHGRYDFKQGFYDAPLPILDLRGRPMTEELYQVIPKYTPE